MHCILLFLVVCEIILYIYIYAHLSTYMLPERGRTKRLVILYHPNNKLSFYSDDEDFKIWKILRTFLT